MRELAAKGTLESVGDGSRLYVTEESVRRFQSRIRRPGRLFSPRIAFAALICAIGRRAGMAESRGKIPTEKKAVHDGCPTVVGTVQQEGKYP